MTTLALAAAARVAALVVARSAILQGLVSYADSGTGASRIQIYASTRPPIAGDDPAATPIATLVLTKPSGAVADGVLSLTQASVVGDLIAANGAALWARWETSAGDPVADGDVTDMAGDGPFKLAGADGVNLNAGGRAILGAVALT